MAASNTDDAVALCADNLPTVVVTDINMPVRDGVWLLNHLKAHCPGVPVIAISGMYDAVSAHYVGFDTFLRKPVDPDKLRAAIADLVRPRAEVEAAMTTEDGDRLEPVGDGEVPEILPHDGERVDD